MGHSHDQRCSPFITYMPNLPSLVDRRFIAEPTTCALSWRSAAAKFWAAHEQWPASKLYGSDK